MDQPTDRTGDHPNASGPTTPAESAGTVSPDDVGGDGAGVTAFVPGHVTAFFSAHRRTDPARSGSRGAGVTLTDGVRVTVRPRGATDGGCTSDFGPETPDDDRAGGTPGATGASEGDEDDPGTIVLNDERVVVEPVGRVLDGLGVDATVVARAELPLGAGFGVSGALSLATALAANAAAGSGRSENELVELAHVAEVESGTGLGDVVAQARGGVPLRLEPGGPDHGRLDGIPARPRVEYVTFGELSTAEVLGGDTTTLTAAGERALAVLRETPTLPRLMELSRRFAREADLLVPEVAEAIAAVDAVDGQAAMAMLGRSVFALGTGLSDAGYEPHVCLTHPAGATLVAADDR
jgi:pantoate kinase